VRRLEEVEHLLQHPSGGASKGVQPGDEGQHPPDAVLSHGCSPWHEQPGAWSVRSASVGPHKALHPRIAGASLEASQVHCHS